MMEGAPRHEQKEVYKLSEIEKDAYRETIEQIEYPLKEILRTLRPEIERGTYRVIIGDDASGRLPTLVLGQVIGAVYQKQGLEKPISRFIAGSTQLKEKDKTSRDTKKEEVKNHIARIADDAGITSEGMPMFLKSLGVLPKDKKVLIVTDTIETGESVKFLLKALAANNLSADVVTITDLGGEPRKSRRISGAEVHNGGMIFVPGIYNKSFISGVTKNPEELFATPLRISRGDSSKVQAVVNYSREVASEISERLTQEYLEHEPVETRF